MLASAVYSPASTPEPLRASGASPNKRLRSTSARTRITPCDSSSGCDWLVLPAPDKPLAINKAGAGARICAAASAR